MGDDHGRRIVTRHGLVESWMRWKSHVRFGERPGETDRWEQRHGAPGQFQLANHKLDESRRRVQNETLGHRGRKDDPLYRARRLLTKAHERIDDKAETKLLGLLDTGDPNGEVRDAWHAKEVVRSVYDITDAKVAEQFVCELAIDLQHEDRPLEVRSLGRTLARWFDEITNWHKAFVTNGSTEAVNNLIKRIKRIGFGFRPFTHYRIRILLYAGRPNWDLLPTITPR